MDGAIEQVRQSNRSVIARYQASLALGRGNGRVARPSYLIRAVKKNLAVGAKATYMLVRRIRVHDSLTIANRFLEVATEKGDTLTPMQLLKAVYIAHGWMLGLYGVPLINDEVQAWKYGPVIPKLYKAINAYRDQPVRGPLRQARDEPLVEVEDSLIKQVFDIYGRRSGIELSRLTHQQGSPWAQTYVDGVPNVVISNDIIEDHYRMLAGKASGQQS